MVQSDRHRACRAHRAPGYVYFTSTQSLGSTLLDESALKLAKAATGHYRPTTEDNQAISDCYEYRIRFELHN